MSTWIRETGSAEETIEAGRQLAKYLALSQLLILEGAMGAGKTTLVKGIAEGLGVAAEDQVTSPTFILVHAYGEEPGPRLYHLDLYRLEEDRQLWPLGIEEMLDSGALVLVEWGERFARLRELADGVIRLRHGTGDRRRITLERY